MHCLLNAAETILPVKTVSKHTKPYWNENLKELHRKEREELVKWLEGGRPREKDNRLFRNYKIAKDKFREVQRTASDGFMDKSTQEVEIAADCDLRLFWKLIKGKNKKQSESCVELIVNNEVVSKPDLVSSEFESYYGDLSVPKDNRQFDSRYTLEIEERLKTMVANSDLNSHRDILDDEITEDELKTVISKLKKLKAPGWDLIQNEHFIYGGDSVKRVLCILFNKVMELDVIPDSWKKGVIITMYKGHNKRKTSMESYRPVSLLPVMLKIYEKLLYNQIMSYLNSTNISFPNSQQQGFQPNLSCVTTAYTVQEVI